MLHRISLIIITVVVVVLCACSDRVDLQRKIAILACNADDVETLDLCLDSGVSVNSRDEEGDPLLLLAIKSYSKNVFFHLLSESADVNALDKNGWPPIVHCGQRGEFGVVAATNLVAYGADLNYRMPCGSTPLGLAAFVGNRMLVSELIDLGASVDYISDKGVNLLMYAVVSGNVELVRDICSLTQEKINDLDHFGQNAFFYLLFPSCIALYNTDDFREIAGILASSGCRMDITNSTGRSVMTIADSVLGSNTVSFLRSLEDDLVNQRRKSTVGGEAGEKGDRCN